MEILQTIRSYLNLKSFTRYSYFSIWVTDFDVEGGCEAPRYWPDSNLHSSSEYSMEYSVQFMEVGDSFGLQQDTSIWELLT